MLSTEQFWLFSCQYYENKDAQKTLLALQNEHNKNINLCLLLLFLEKYGLTLALTEIKQAAKVCLKTDEPLLLPHRQIRAQLKQCFANEADYSSIKAQLLKTELAIEKLQQTHLIAFVTECNLERHTSPDNLSFYLEGVKDYALICASLRALL